VTSELLQPNKIGHFISAPWRSSGKSVLSIGLARVALRRQQNIQTFKKGPDYIDPLWLKKASGKSCYNLDPYIQSEAEWRELFQHHAADMNIVEGTMGLHDGLAVDGSDSNAAIAKALGLPVLLIVDCRGMHRTIAALINGLVQFDSALSFSGVILNRIRSDRHADKICSAVSQYCSLPVLGAIPDTTDMNVDDPAANDYIDVVADRIESACDLDRLFQPNTTLHAEPQNNSRAVIECKSTLRVGIAMDKAFHFYYEDDLDSLKSRGVELVPFSPLSDALPGDLDGILIGGGFPERHVEQLSANVACREAIVDAVGRGVPIRAECGGLMYLCKSLECGNKAWPMVGIFDGDVCMYEKPQGRGYMKLKRISNGLPFCSNTNIMSAHEFHHSTITFHSEPDGIFDVLRGYGVNGDIDGLTYRNVIASYAHFRHTNETPWIDWFLDTIQRANLESRK